MDVIRQNHHRKIKQRAITRGNRMKQKNTQLKQKAENLKKRTKIIWNK